MFSLWRLCFTMSGQVIESILYNLHQQVPRIPSFVILEMIQQFINTCLLKESHPLLLLGFSDHPAASALFNRAANTSGLLQQIANHLIVSQEPEIDHQIVDVIYNPVWESSLPHHPNQQICKPKNDRQL